MIDNQCHCPCHTDSGIRHIVECCSQCPHCNRNIKYMKAHLGKCTVLDKKSYADLQQAETFEESNVAKRSYLDKINTLDDYQEFANEMSGHEFATFSDESAKASHELVFNLIGLCGETGEVAEKIKKAIRHSNINDVSASLTAEKKKGIALELGDVLYYLARVTDMIGLKLSDIACLNQEKLLDRVSRDVVKGEGDYR